ncbi:hypothetical protein J6590_034783 [Homalodisca vitripennis]|nr:hypothetical protein J6590_034783 [Homalodisca vitripennis]
MPEIFHLRVADITLLMVVCTDENAAVGRRGCKHNLERAKVKFDTYYSVRGSMPEIFQSRVADITLLMVVCSDERMMPLVVRGCKHNLERAKVIVDTYYSVRGSMPEIFQSRVADITLLMVVCSDERMMPLVVRGCKHNLERAKVKVDTYYSVRGSMPEIFQSRVADIILLMVVCTDERMLPLVVRGCKHNLERAKVEVDTYYSVRGSMPEIFQSRVAGITLLMVVCTDDRMLPLIFRGCKHNLERAKVKLDTYYSVRGTMPEIFHLRVADITLLMVVCTDERMLPLVVRGCKHNLERAKVKVDTYYSVRGSMPEIFQSRDPLGQEILEASKHISNRSERKSLSASVPTDQNHNHFPPQFQPIRTKATFRLGSNRSEPKPLSTSVSTDQTQSHFPPQFQQIRTKTTFRLSSNRSERKLLSALVPTDQNQSQFPPQFQLIRPKTTFRLRSNRSEPKPLSALVPTDQNQINLTENDI